MEHYEIIHTEQVQGFNIVFSITSEDHAPDWDFESEEAREDTLRKIESGELAYFIARVQAFKNGILLGTDYLGGCCYDSPMQFVEQNDYYADMVSSVIVEAQGNIKALCASTLGKWKVLS